MVLARRRYNERMPGGHQGDDVRPASSGPTEGVKLTYDDFLLFPDDGKRHELIDGEHYVTPSPNIKHQRRPRSNLHSGCAVLPGGASHRQNLLRTARHRAVASIDVVEPDLFYISHERAAEVLTAAERARRSGTGDRDRVDEYAEA